jgi:hypothetical protein
MVVKHSPRHLKIKGLRPAATGTENEEMAKNMHADSFVALPSNVRQV